MEIAEFRRSAIRDCMTGPDRGFDWNHARAFLAVVEAGTLTGAARRLGLTQPTLGRQVAALERALGLDLFERGGRALALTETGRELAERLGAMEAAAARAALFAAGREQAVEGRLRITASDVIAALVLPPVFAALRAAAPRLQVKVVATNDLSDLIRREADIAVRHVRPEHPELIARHLRDATAGLYAARSYLAARGRPETVADLAAHDFVGLGAPEAMAAHLAARGLPVGPAQVRIWSESGLVAWELVRRGFGIAPMADEVAAAAPEVERVLPGTAPIRFPVWLAAHRELRTSGRVRLAFDMLAGFLERPAEP